jgi:hypothetical protein
MFHHFLFKLTVSHRYLCLCTPCHLCFALARHSSRHFSIQGGRRGGRPEGQGEAPECQSLAATLELGSEGYKALDFLFMFSLSIVLRSSFLCLVPIMHIFNDSTIATTLSCIRIFPNFTRSPKVSVHSRWYIISFILQQPTHIYIYQALPDTEIGFKNINQYVTYISSPKPHSIARTNTTKNIELPTIKRRFGEYHKQSIPQRIINHSGK